MERLALINLEGVSEAAGESYRLREAARAIVFDMDKNIALLHATKNGYYKLPGGGIEAGESKEAALARECREEIGCNIESIEELGSITEYRKMFELKQISYCYTARVVGEKGMAHLEEGEVAEGFETAWLSFTDAQMALAQSVPATAEGAYIVARDAVFLEAAGRRLGLV